MAQGFSPKDDMKKFLRVLWCVAIICAILLLTAVTYFMFAGIPTPIVRRYLTQLEDTHRVRITVGKVHWRPWHRFTARNVHVAADAANLTADIERVVVDLGPTLDLPSDLPTARCQISEAQVHIAGEKAAPPKTIQLASGDLLRFPDGNTRFTMKAILMDDWDCAINGELGAITNGVAGDSSLLGGRLAEGARRAHEILRSFGALREKRVVPDSLTARVLLNARSGDSQGTRAWAWIEGGPMLIHGLAIGNCSVSLQWTNGEVRIDSIRAVGPNFPLCIEGRGTIQPQTWNVAANLRVRASPADLAEAGLLSSNHLALARHVGPLDGHLDVAGTLRDLTAINVAFHATSLPDTSSHSLINVAHAQGHYSQGVLHIGHLRLSSSDPMSCLPESLRESVADMGLHSVGPVRADLTLGPAPIPDIMSNLSGRVSCSKLGYQGIELAQVDLGFRRNGTIVNITDTIAVIQADRSHRSVTGRGTFDLDGACAFRLESDAETTILATVLPSKIAPLVASLEVSGSSRTEVQLTRSGPPTRNLVIRGTIDATDVSRFGVAADLLHASFAWTNRTFQVYDLAIVRADGHVTGRFAYKPDERLLSIDGRSTAPAALMARFVTPGLTETLSAFRFEGPTSIECRGTIGLKGNPTRNLRLHVDGKSLGWRWFLADAAVLDVFLGEQTTAVQNLYARWCKGNVSGSVRFERSSQTNEPGRCSIDLMLTEANLAAVVDVFRDFEDAKAYEGNLSGRVTLTGDAGPRFLETAAGSGRIDIQDGYILTIPLFGGLSKYLSVLIPGLGYASQRDLRAGFKIGDGRLETSDAELSGKLVSLRGKGSYAFADDIKGRVQVQFLKEGLTATVTRFITSPLTKALEFEVTGTTHQPRWRPVNTPDRLLRFFGEKLGKLVPAGAPRDATDAAPDAANSDLQ